MTPEEFRSRAEAAVAPLDPSPAAYARLRASTSRRRTARTLVPVAAATVTVMLAATAVLAQRVDASKALAPAAPTAVPTIAPLPLPTSAPEMLPTTAPSLPAVPSATPTAGIVVATRTGDLDGDGVRDRVQLVETGSRPAAIVGLSSWRWGIRVSLSSGGTQTDWRDPDEDAMEAQELLGVADVNDDGRGEVVLSPGGSASTRAWELQTLVAGRLVRVTGEPLRNGIDGASTRHWGCVGDRVYVTRVTRDGRHYRGRYEHVRLVDDGEGRAWLRRTGRAWSARWAEGEQPPEEFRDETAFCGLRYG